MLYGVGIALLNLVVGVVVVVVVVVVQGDRRESDGFQNKSTW